MFADCYAQTRVARPVMVLCQAAARSKHSLCVGRLRSAGLHRGDDLLREAEGGLDAQRVAEVHDEVFDAEAA